MTQLAPIGNAGSDVQGRREARARTYATEAFATEAADILDLDPAAVRRALEVLLDTDAFPSGDMIEASAAGADAATMIMAFASETTGPSAIVDQVRSLSSMDFQCEYGTEATGDRKGRRHAVRPSKDRFGTQLSEKGRRHAVRPSKDRFGTQLSEIMCDLGARHEDRATLTSVGKARVVLGWDVQHRAYGQIDLRPPYREVGLLYSIGVVFPDLHPAIRLGSIELDLKPSLETTETQLHHFACVVRDLFSPLSDADLRNQFESFVTDASGSLDLPWREGWDIRAGDKPWEDDLQLNRIRRFPGDLARRFASDEEAFRHVRSLAAIGSALHRLALDHHHSAVPSAYSSTWPKP
jgi:hypothetical protein